MSKRTQQIGLIFLLGSFLFAQELSNISGAYTDVGYGVRPMGMGGAFTAVSDDPNAAYYNPAGLMKVPYPGISLMYTRQMTIVPYYYTTFQSGITENQAIGAAVLYNGDALYNEFEFMASYAFNLGKYFNEPFNKLYLGLGAQYRHVGFGKNEDGGIGQMSGVAYGYGANLGMLWEFLPDYSFAVVWRDFLDQLQWETRSLDDRYFNNYNEDIPAALTFGFAASNLKNTLISMDLKKSLRKDTHDRIALGFETKFFRFLLPRFGISQNLFTSKEKQNRHINLGIGIEPEFAESSVGVAVNFAYQFTDIVPTLRFGLDVDWGIQREKPLPPVAAIVARPDTIQPGEKTLLKWITKNATFVTIEPDIGEVDIQGEFDIQPERSMVYTIRAAGPGGISVYTTNVVVEAAPKPVLEVKAVPDTVWSGDPAHLIWNSFYAASVTLKEKGDVGVSGDLEIRPDSSRTYIFKASGKGGEVTGAAHIFVKPKPQEVKRKFVLKGINFETGSARITAESYAVLNEVVQSLLAYPEVKVEIQGYTDATGSQATNMRLSQERAEAVLFYFIGKGIDAGRLRASGYGPANPIASNATREGRALNRRIEIVRID
jgi:outer membrane protein OmpA-like peptidoglycan-associated protein